VYLCFLTTGFSMHSDRFALDSRLLMIKHQMAANIPALVINQVIRSRPVDHVCEIVSDAPGGQSQINQVQ
jgi:hypothetical protein